jgi:PPE-repeat protein
MINDKKNEIEKIENELVYIEKSMSNIKNLLELISNQTNSVINNPKNTTFITVEHQQVLNLMNESYNNNEDFQKPIDYISKYIRN